VACIGAATAAAARRAGLTPELVPEGEALPETLVRDLAAHAKLDTARVLLPQGREARDTLESALAAAAADVCAVEVYRNVTPPGAAERVRAALDVGVEAVLLTSPSTVERLAAALPDGGLAGLAKAAVLACIGPTTADALRQAGARAAVVADEQSAEGLVAALERHFSEGSHAVSR
jgi:uroporphyrinogen-III synthase